MQQTDLKEIINGCKQNKEKYQLPENQHLSLLGIAFDCGFNSKATFNRVFKKMTGMSPKEWKV